MDLRTAIFLWFVVLAVVLFSLRAQATFGVGLVLAYVLNLALLHLPGALLYLNPEYEYYKRSWIELGFAASTYSIVGFGIGALVVGLFLREERRREAEAWQANEAATDVNDAEALPKRTVFHSGLVWLYVLLGLLSYFVISPLASNVPTASAVISVLNQLLLLGICLGMWNAWQKRNLLALAFWVATLGALPVMTIVVQGFIGFGTVALLTGLSFLVSFFRPRWLILAVGIVFVMLGVSAFVTYFRDRDEIRHIVWGGEAFEERAAQMLETFGEFELFDPTNVRHVRSIDLRLNQNWLVGAAIENIEQGGVELRNGETIVDAVIALVPRAIWPDKPVRAGSGSLVSDATGIQFQRGTSVGVGQVLEFYINFGTLGVIVGGFFWGAALTLLDGQAARAILTGNARRFTLFYLIGLGMIQPGGSLVEVTATTAAAVVTALIVNDILVPFFISARQSDAETDQSGAEETGAHQAGAPPLPGPYPGWE